MRRLGSYGNDQFLRMTGGGLEEIIEVLTWALRICRL